MRLFRSPAHVTDEDLVAFADGEFPARREGRVRRHLQACWNCRARLSAIERTVAALGESLEQTEYTAAGADSHMRLLDRIEGVEAGFEPRRPRKALAGLAGIAALLAVLAFPLPTGPGPREALESVRRAERTAAAVHQVFDVELAGAGGSGRLSSRLEVWSDEATGRYAMRWTGDGSRLKAGLWKPERRGSAIEQVPAAGDPREAGFLRWVRARPPRAISIAEYFTELAAMPGARLRQTRLQRDDGEISLVFRLDGIDGRRRIHAEMEVDPASLRPRRCRMRVEDGPESFDLQLVARACEPLDAGHLGTALFRPEGAVPGVPRREQRKAAAPADPSAAGLPTRAEMDGAEIAVRYALHRAQACLGAPVEVIRGAVRIRVRLAGLEETRQAGLRAALEGVAGHPLVRIEQEESQSGGPRLVTRQVIAGERESPLDARLRESLPSGGSAGDEIAAFSNSVLRQSDEALSHAWALRHLAERYGSEESLPRGAEARLLLDAMIREHSGALRPLAGALRRQLASVLPAPGPSGAEPVGDWPASTMALFEETLRINGQVARLFAAARTDGKEPRAAGDLPDAVVRLERILDAVNARGLRAFVREAK